MTDIHGQHLAYQLEAHLEKALQVVCSENSMIVTVHLLNRIVRIETGPI